jgi:PAS domain S-box-containing protein
MDVYWIGELFPPKGVALKHVHFLEETEDSCLLFIDDPKIIKRKDTGSRRIYLVHEGLTPKRIPASIMGIVPKDGAVMNAIAMLYNEMWESFELGDMLITSLGEKDLTIKEKQRVILRDSKRYKSIIKNANDLIFILGPSGKIIFCNDTFKNYLEDKGTSLLGRSFVDFVIEEDRSNLDIMLHKGFSMGVPVRTEVRMSLLGGRTGIFSLLSTPLEEEGRIYSLSIIGRDITDIRAMQRRLTIQANDLSQMINGLSHELRNPLTIIGAYIRRLEREKGDKTRKWEQALSGIYSSIKRIEDMISRIEHYEMLTRMEPSCSQVEICTLIRQCVSMFETPVPVRVNAPKKIDAFCDPEHVRVAFNRILENAVQTGTTEVIIDISCDINYAMISVRDFGPGIKDKVQTIYAPFYSTDPMKTGLGLTEARIAMVKIHGDIDVVRQADPGAIFTLKVLLDRRLKSRE